jgi:hypothetical protein
MYHRHKLLDLMTILSIVLHCYPQPWFQKLSSAPKKQNIPRY